jgi:predicted ester cyclase
MDAMHAALARVGLSAQLRFFAERSRSHGVDVTREQLGTLLEDIETTFPDVTIEVLDLVVDGDLAFGRYAMSGTHLGTQRLPYVHGGVLCGVAPTGRRFRAEHAHLWRFEGGEIVGHDAVQDNLELARQLGVLPGSAGDGLSRPAVSSRSWRIP